MKTLKVYKLLRKKKTHPGKLFPLFIGSDKPTPLGQWLTAEFLPKKGFAHRPGWHVGPLPIADHLLRKDGTLAADRVWAECEILAEVDYQGHANASPTKDMRNRVPLCGYYRFPRPKHQGGEWLIAGNLKINKVLSHADVAAVLGR
jgi:hypothetical protein